jgi:chaperonin GroES
MRLSNSNLGLKSIFAAVVLKGGMYLMSKKVKIRPLADRLLVQRIEEKEVKVGNLYVPDSAKEKPLEAEVVATGPGRLSDEGKRVPMEVSEGQRILIGKYAGTDVKVNGEEYLILREDDVLAILS